MLKQQPKSDIRICHCKIFFLRQRVTCPRLAVPENSRCNWICCCDLVHCTFYTVHFLYRIL